MHPSLALVLVAAGQGVDQAWADKARSELPAMIERRLQLSSRLDEITEYTSKAKPGAQPKTAARFRERTSVDETSRLADNLLFKSTTKHDDKSQETLVRCRNPHYAFKLTRKGAEGKYVLVSHSSAPPKLEDELGRAAHYQMISYMQDLLSVLESKDKDTTLRRLAWDAERSLVVMEYVVRPDDPKRILESRVSSTPRAAGRRWRSSGRPGPAGSRLGSSTGSTSRG